MIFALCTDTIIIPGINLKHLSISLSSYQRRYVDTKRTIFGTALGWKGLNDKGDPDILINRDRIMICYTDQDSYLRRMFAARLGSAGGWLLPLRLLLVKSLTKPFLLFFLFTEELFLNSKNPKPFIPFESLPHVRTLTVYLLVR